MTPTTDSVISAFKSLDEGEQQFVLDKIENDRSDLMTDEEVAAALRISVRTFHNHLKDGPPKGSKGGDVRLIRERRIGRSRRWLRSSVEKFING